MSEENKNISNGEENGVEFADQPKTEEAVGGDKTQTVDAVDTVAKFEDSALFGTTEDSGVGKVKPPRRVSLAAFICTCVALVLAAVMLTYTVCSSVYQRKLAEARLENVSQSAQSGEYDELELLKRLFEAYSFEELDDGSIKIGVLTFKKAEK